MKVRLTFVIVYVIKAVCFVSEILYIENLWTEASNLQNSRCKVVSFAHECEHIRHDPSNQKSYTAIHLFNITARLAVAFAFFFFLHKHVKMLALQSRTQTRKTVKLCYNKWAAPCEKVL